MKKITANKFIYILKQDKLYSSNEITTRLINSIALRNSVKLYFCGYLYGVSDRVIAKDVITVEYKDNIDKNNVTVNGKKQFKVYVFKPCDINLKQEVDVYKEKVKEIAADTVELDRWCFEERDRLIKEFCKNNDMQTQFLTTILATGLEFIHKDSIVKMNAQQFWGVIEATYEGCLLGALDNIILTSDFIQKYFIENHLPLPSALYPGEAHSSEVFMKNYTPSAWDNYDQDENFKLFYSEKTKDHDKSRHYKKMEDDSIPGISQNDVSTPTKEQPTIPKTKIQELYAFYKSGQMWVVKFNGKENIFKNTLGMFYIHQILQAEHNGISLYDLSIFKDGHGTQDEDNNFIHDKEILDESCEYSKAETESKNKIDLTKFLEEIKNKELECKESYLDGRISQDVYEGKLKDFNGMRKEVYDLNRNKLDKTSKMIYARITRSIRGALKVIEECNRDLYVHIKSACRPDKGVFHYTRPAGIEWKLFY